MSFSGTINPYTWEDLDRNKQIFMDPVSNYNNINMVTFNCKSIKRTDSYIKDLCQSADIVALQETWLLPHDLDFVHSIDKRFACTSAGVLRGRPYGGLAILWSRSRFPEATTVVNCSSDRLAAVRFSIGQRFFLVINIYMPTDEPDNLPEFTDCLGRVSAIIEECNTQAVFVVGDFKADPNARFGRELQSFCNDQRWLCADTEKLGVESDTFTFISQVHGTRSWLDHCVVTEAAWQTLQAISVSYDVSWSDHFPLRIVFKADGIMEGCQDNVEFTSDGTRWGIRDSKQIESYKEYCTTALACPWITIKIGSEI